MVALKRVAGAYLILVAVAVAVYFIVNNFLLDEINVTGVWQVLDVLMFIGLAAALYFNYLNKREESESGYDGAVTRRYMDASILFYLTVAVAILFLHNWFALLALGSDSLDGNHQAWVIWAIVDTLLPITFGVTGCRLWSEADQYWRS